MEGESAEELTVGRVAGLSGVTVRTLHHYDQIGLVCPSGRTAAGYRVYSPADLERLRQVLVYRELGFPLEEIRALVSDPGVDTAAHLRRQRGLLVERGERLAALGAALDRHLEARAMGMRLTPEEQLEVFGTDKVGGEWADEAEHRFGETDAYQESQRRAASYTKDDWARLKAESDAALRAWREALLSGLPADGPETTALAEEHRQHITRWFYDCGYDIHVGLAEMYLADERFTQVYEIVAPGLARYVHDAILANAPART
ncbi:MerR family transcriptional regulator [Pseudofrankia sp. BMG5.37]|uniref:MerR family transcriptional regulator n=1 Tax=Pseudofrankia sp. BMG5.37 TaxID=3050035 RepID=UPI0028962558|nr:MerR family transcriptional regulator [Pseudofrankia sp. BMG5.37]MDT3440948.1 MerR family transcriptional regulator [Pseudofrankia sp. BMG5.37]